MFLLLAGGVTRLPCLPHPATAVWDEYYYVPDAMCYLEGRYYLDIHPPLGKLLLAIPLKLAGVDPEKTDKHSPSVPARIPPAIAGALLPALLYGLARSLSMSRGTAFVAGGLALFDTALLSESHFALIDIFVPTFVVSALWAFVRHRAAEPMTRAWWIALSGAALLAAAALSTKWTGLSACGLMLALSAWDAFRSRAWRILAIRAGVTLGTAAAVYVAVFALHFHLLPRSGPGNARMSEGFRATLEDSPESKRADLERPGFLAKLVETNRVMGTVSTTKRKTWPQSSPWYGWPAGRSRVTLWESGAERVIMLANPVVWPFASLSLLAALLYPWLRRARWQAWLASDPAAPSRRFALNFLLLAFAANWLPFAFVGRAAFLYHYFTALLASLLVGALFCFEILPAAEGWAPAGERVITRRSGALLAAAAAVFVFLMPLSYGYASAYDAALRAWLGS